VWSLSTAKQGFGVENLRDGNLETFWQSDGPQPHLATVQFYSKMPIAAVALYVDSRMDESYTPSRISIRLGSSFQDLYEVRTVALDEPSGWISISLLNADRSCPRAMVLQLAVLQNHQNGRDTHIRQIKIFGPGQDASRQYLLVPHFEEPEQSMYCDIR